jgi:hypothetical protein
MGKVKNKDPFQTERWGLEKTTDPYIVFEMCFNEVDDINFYRRLIRDVFLFMDQDRAYNKTEPYKIYCGFQAIHSVIDASYFLYRQKEFDDCSGYDNCYSKNEKKCGDEPFAKYFISLKEYKNPSLAFKEFFEFQRYKDWKESLNILLLFGLSKCILNVERNWFSIYYYLIKLMEAAHLTTER